ncbi:MAG: hypothetical protein Q8919_07805, partial [Bacteroidota bacterium]|nr:hypothetical protein [Bacteroidota bacterium]
GPVVNAGKDTAVCPGDGVTLNGSVSGGIGPYNSTVWLPTTGLSNNKILNPKATPAVTTKYHLYVTDEVGCTGEDSMTVVVRKPPQLNPKLNDSVCIGMTAVIGDSATGGQGPYTYLWSPITRLSSYNVATPTVTPIANSTYTETVTDANGCQTQVVIKVTVVPPPKPVVSGPNSVCINSTEGYTIKGKKGDAYFWSLSGGGTLTNSLQSDSVTILWTTAGVWIITVSDTNAQGCIGDSSYTVTVSSTLTPDITPSGNVSYCKGDSVILYASKGYATYRWSDGSTLDSLVVKQSGSYSVAVTSSGGCSGTSNPVNVTENPSPVFTVTADGPTHLCPGSSVHLTASSGFDKYVWSSGETTPMITVTSAGTYTVQVTNSFGCSAVSPPIAITIDPNLTPVITPDGPLSFCMGDSVTLDAGAGYSTYQWSKDGAVIPSATSEKLTVVQSGSYTVAVTSGSCSGTSVPTVVTVFPLPAQPVITQSGTTLSSTPATTYQWLLNGTKISGATAQTLIESQDGSYTVTITDANGCSNTSAPFVILSQATATVRVGQVPTAIPGGKVEVPIELVTSQNLIPVGADHYKGTLRYNGTMLVPTGSSGGSVSPTSAITGSTDRTVGFDGRSAPMTSGTLQKIQFDAMLGNDTCTTLTIDTFYWTDASVAVTREDGDFCETGICVSGGELRLVNGSGKFGMSPIRPNPSVSHIRIEYDLIETGRTKIALMDLLGREVKIVRDEDEKPGHYAIDVSLGEMSSGYYLSTLRTPTQITMQPFVLQK